MIEILKKHNLLGSFPEYLTGEKKFKVLVYAVWGNHEEYWFKQMWNINLPDAKDGYAIINIDKGKFSLETYSKGITI